MSISFSYWGRNLGAAILATATAITARPTPATIVQSQTFLFGEAAASVMPGRTDSATNPVGASLGRQLSVSPGAARVGGQVFLPIDAEDTAVFNADRDRACLQPVEIRCGKDIKIVGQGAAILRGGWQGD